MNPQTRHDQRRELLIARLLGFGTVLASAIIAIGLLLHVMRPTSHGMAAMKAGVALFIALPTARVALMLLTFLREKDFTYALIASLVLAIIAAGALAAL